MSGANYFLIERRVRKQKLLELIKNNPHIAEKKLRGLFSLQTDLSSNKIDRYLSELEDVSLIEFADDRTVTVVE